MLPSLNILQISYENADSEKIILVVSEFGRLLFYVMYDVGIKLRICTERGSLSATYESY